MTEVTAVFVEIMADVTGGTVAVIGKGFNYNGNAVGSVALVNDIFIFFIGFARGFFKHTVDVIVGYVVSLCFSDNVAKL